MTRILAILFIVLFILAAPRCFAQTRIAISYPDTEQKEQVVHISYYINDSEAADKFSVSLVVTDPQGKSLNASSLSGDVGYNVSGGGLKQIAWDAGADSILLNKTLDIRIVVEALSPTRWEVQAQEEARRQQEAYDALAREESISNLRMETSVPLPQSKSFTRGGLVFRSLVFPGWGLSIAKSKPHWIKGLAAYGCVAGSLILNRKAVDSYGQINEFEDYENKDMLYNQAVTQDNMSEALAYGAIGIWVAEFVWTLVGTRGTRTFEVHPKMDPLTYTPMIGFTYRF